MSVKGIGWAMFVRKAFVVVLVLHAVYLYYLLIVPKQHLSYLIKGRFCPESTLNTLRRAQIRPRDLGKGCSNGTLQSQKNYRRVNSIVTSYDDVLRGRLLKLIERQAPPDDPEVIALIRHLLDPPSHHIVKPVRHIVETPQSIEVVKILNSKQNGFYVECGALDGERSSNTLHLEHYRKWEGLLIEMDPYYYTQLLGKSRKAWSINACISPSNVPSELEFNEASGGTGSLIETESQSVHGVTMKVPCFPLKSILLAMNRTRVDYFSLDVEGIELDILKSLSFSEVDVKVWSVEYVHDGKSGKRAIREFMEGNGYKMHADISLDDPKISLYVDDFIFVKKTLVSE